MLFSRTDRSFLGQWWWTVDRPMMAALLLLAGIGVMLVTTASPPVASQHGLPDFHFLVKHMIFLIPSLALMIGASMLASRQIWRAATLLFLSTIAAMILVLFIGVEIKGAQRWLHLPGFSIQPSEFIKPAFAVVSAWFMARQKESMTTGQPDKNGYKIAIGLYALAMVLLLAQPDFGMSVVLTSIFLAQIFLVGFPIRWVFALIGVGGAGVTAAYFGLHHVRDRIDRFLDPSSGDNYQVEKSLEAFQHGGLFGTGPGQGEVKLLLPDAHADFIFAVAGEEMGFFAVLIIVGTLFFVLYRGFVRLMETQDMFRMLAVGGLLAMLGLQALVHMGSSLQLLPAKGMTLPFMSYGGSSLLSISLSMGVVLALTRRDARAGISKGGLAGFSRKKMKHNKPGVEGI